MSKDDNSEVFSSEFRHEAVAKFVRGLIDGSIKLLRPVDAESLDSLSSQYVDIIKEIEQYVSGKLRGNELEDIEKKLFRHLAILRAADAIEETYTKSQMEQEIERLHARIDSTNTLLLEILVILKELMKRLD